MASEADRTLYQRFMQEVVNEGDIAKVDDIMAPDFTEHEDLPPELPRTVAGVKQLFSDLRRAFPDLHVVIEDKIAEGDMVVGRITFHGTHRGDFNGLAPTGRVVAWGAVDIVRIFAGKIVEHWGVVDRLSLLHQLGAIGRPDAKH